MSNNRKLQGEIDRLMKKVQEGCLEFDNILAKVYAATSPNQKEKYEADLKKEIKKLQRSREQIKTWIASNEVRQKTQLLDARKNIENKMELFKSCEKDSKTKAFSKEGLLMNSNDEDGKGEIRQWIGRCLKELKNQIDVFESEIEAVPIKKRATTARVDELNEKIARHKFHLEKLEKVLRNVENDSVGVDLVNEIKDTVEYYVDSNQEPDFMEEDENLYDALPLKDDDDKSFLLKASGEFGDSDSLIGSDDDDDNISEDSYTSSNSSTSVSSGNLAYNSNSTSNSVAAARQQMNIPINKKDGPTPSPGSSTNTTPRGNQTASNQQYQILNNVKKDGATATQNFQSYPNTTQNQNQFQNTNTTSTTNQVPQRKNSNTPIPVNMQNNPNFNNQQRNLRTSNPNPQQGKAQQQPQTQQTQQAQGQNQKDDDQPFNRAHPSVQYNQFVRNAPGSSGSQQAGQTTQQPQQQLQQQQLQQQYPQQGPQPTQPVPTHPLPQPYSMAAMLAQQQRNQPNGLNIIPPQSQTPPPQQPQNQQQQPLLHQQNIHQQQHQQIQQQHQQHQPIQQMQMPTQQFNHLSLQDEDLQRPDSIKDDTKSNENFDPNEIHSHTLAELSSVSNPDAITSMSLLETSMRNVPEPIDSERPRPYVPRTPWISQSYYPQNPLSLFDNPATFEKFDTDTLFFIFYYQQGSYQQYLAAKELKKQSWRYHKKYLTWFQRHEEPKEITNDYEQGTYVYFDYETGWCQRKKTEFTFEYRYLEDYD